MLLDLIQLSRALERLRIDLVESCDLFNMVDCFEHLLRLGGIHNRGFFTQVDFKEALMRLGVRGDRNTMDRLYLFFRRYNRRGDDALTLGDLLVAICPLHPKVAVVLKSRPSSVAGGFAHERVFDYFTVEKLTALIDAAIETEVQMEIIRQQLRARPDFEAGAAFLTMLAHQRGTDRDAPDAGAYLPGGIAKYVTPFDLETLMRRHEHLDELTPHDIELLIQRFDRDGDGAISINEVSIPTF